SAALYRRRLGRRSRRSPKPIGEGGRVGGQIGRAGTVLLSTSRTVLPPECVRRSPARRSGPPGRDRHNRTTAPVAQLDRASDYGSEGQGVRVLSGAQREAPVQSGVFGFCRGSSR